MIDSIEAPLVSICTITFNHEKYIKEAIDSFLMQKTTFAFEIVIYDDASTDKTADIIRGYEAKYPKVIKPLYQSDNQYSKGVRGIAAKFTFPRANGKYIALCEGDDYWTDPYKLQKQVDFLEANPDYGLVHTDCDVFIQHKNKYKSNINIGLSNYFEICSNKEQFELLINGSYKIRTATVIFKKELLTYLPQNQPKFLMGDTPLWLVFSQNTKFKYIGDSTAVYRVLKESTSHSKTKKKIIRFCLSQLEARIYYSKKYSFQLSPILTKRYNNTLIEYKLVDPKYQQMYPMIYPSEIQSFLLNNADNLFLQKFFLIYHSAFNYYKIVKRLPKKLLSIIKNIKII
jgi:glycosyltransferase involved in cell wall biosynthesis